MARTRLHSVDDLLDVAEQIVTSGDPSGLTLRALATATGASNGTIYHAFESKEHLLAELWLRASSRLQDLMTEAFDGVARRSETPNGEGVVVAVAAAPMELARRYPSSARLFFAQRADQLFSEDLAPAVKAELGALRKRFVDLMVTLAKGVWGREDREVVEAITVCLVDIPTGVLRRRILECHDIDTVTRERLEAAVHAVLAVPLPPRADEPRIARS